MVRTSLGVHVSSKPVDEVYFPAGSKEHTADLIANQDRQRSQAQSEALKKWGPWLLVAAVVGGGAYFYLRD